MNEKIRSAEAFLKSLEDPTVTMDIMVDRVDPQMLQIINNYSGLIAKVKPRTEIEEKDIITCSMIIGYLLKTHIDRFELEKSIQKNNI